MRFLAVGHVTWDRLAAGEALGGSASYGALAAARLGCEAAVLTAAGEDFEPDRDLPGVAVFWSRVGPTTRFRNTYEDDGTRRSVLTARAPDVDLSPLPEGWQDPDVLLLAPVAGEIGPRMATAFAGGVVGATGQGFVREMAPDGTVRPSHWRDPAGDLAGVHVLFLSDHDLAPNESPRSLLQFVPIVALTRGWEGLTLLTRDGSHDLPSLPRAEVDPTGAGDVFAAAFLVRYAETGDILEAAAFGACAGSCAVEGIGPSSLGDRAEVFRRMALRERLIEDGEWEE